MTWNRAEKRRAREFAARRIADSGPPVVVQHEPPAEPVSVWAVQGGKRRLGKDTWADAMYQNDEALYAIISGDRQNPNHHMTPGDWMTPERSKLFDNNPCRLQLSLMTLRGPALQLTREEIAAYCGLSSMTVYRQEATNWETVSRMPNWVYLLILQKWSVQCWGHRPNYRRELEELALWCGLSNLSRAAYFTTRPRPRLPWGAIGGEA